MSDIRSIIGGRHALLAGLGAVGGYMWSRRGNSRTASRRYAALANDPTPGGARVVIIGAGFAGLAAATELGQAGTHGEKVVPILVDRNNFHLFTPLLYQVATGGVEPGHITYPVRYIARENGFLFRESEVQAIDLERKILRLDDGFLTYDYLIVAVGSVPNFFGMQDVARHALTLKWTGDAVAIRNQIIDAFEKAEIEPDTKRRRDLLSFIVVGGGATGIELIGTLRDLIDEILLRDYPTIRAEEVKLVLVEGRDRLLPGVDPKMADLALEHLRDAGVDVWLNTIVASARGAEGESESPPDNGSTKQGARLVTVTTRDGREATGSLVVWTAGVKASPLVESLSAPKSRNDGRVQVTSYLELPDHTDVYAVGDIASIVDPKTGALVPPNAQAALQEGQAAASNILGKLRGQKSREFKYQSKGDLVSIGRADAIADLFGRVFSGPAALVARRGVYLLNLVGFKNRLDVLIDWAADMLYHPNSSRIEFTRRETFKAVADQSEGPEKRQEKQAEKEEKKSGSSNA